MEKVGWRSVVVEECRFVVVEGDCGSALFGGQNKRATL
jgi:hypothetical protein